MAVAQEVCILPLQMYDHIYLVINLVLAF